MPVYQLTLFITYFSVPSESSVAETLLATAFSAVKLFSSIEHPVSSIEHPVSSIEYAKRTQFPICKNELNSLYYKGLRKCAAMSKRTQNEPNFTRRSISEGGQTQIYPGGWLFIFYLFADFLVYSDAAPLSAAH